MSRERQFREEKLPGHLDVPASAEYRVVRTGRHRVRVAFWGAVDPDTGKAEYSQATAILHPIRERNPALESVTGSDHVRIEGIEYVVDHVRDVRYLGSAAVEEIWLRRPRGRVLYVVYRYRSGAVSVPLAMPR